MLILAAIRKACCSRCANLYNNRQVMVPEIITEFDTINGACEGDEGVDEEVECRC